MIQNTRANEGPAALAGANGAQEDNFATAKYRLRAERATALASALAAANPEDAAILSFAFLDSVSTGGPELGSLGITVGDARMWAEIAPPHELLAYTLAGITELRDKPMPLTARKRLFAALWASFPTAAQQAFLKKVGMAGNWGGR